MRLRLTVRLAKVSLSDRACQIIHFVQNDIACRMDPVGTGRLCYVILLQRLTIATATGRVTI